MGRMIGLAAALAGAAALLFVAINGMPMRADRSAAVDKKPASGTAQKAQDSKGGSKSGSQGGPATVEVARARQAKAANDIRAIGSLQSDESVQLAPEIAGRISEIVFAEGSPVKQGDVLVKLDDALARAEVAQANARLDSCLRQQRPRPRAVTHRQRHRAHPRRGASQLSKPRRPSANWRRRGSTSTYCARRSTASPAFAGCRSARSSPPERRSSTSRRSTR